MIARYGHIVDDDVINAAFSEIGEGNGKFTPVKDLTPAKELIEKNKSIELELEDARAKIRELESRDAEAIETKEKLSYLELMVNQIIEVLQPHTKIKLGGVTLIKDTGKGATSLKG